MLRVGIDLTCSDRFASMDTAGGLAFYKRVFTPKEQEDYGYIPSLLAACFAAKEAVSKVLGTGLTIRQIGRVTCHSIEISNAGMSEPNVHLNGIAFQIAQSRGYEHITLRHVSTRKDEIIYAVGTSGIPATKIRTLLKSLDKIQLFELQHQRNSCSIAPINDGKKSSQLLNGDQCG